MKWDGTGGQGRGRKRGEWQRGELRKGDVQEQTFGFCSKYQRDL